MISSLSKVIIYYIGLNNLDDLCNVYENNLVSTVNLSFCKKLYDFGFYTKLE